MARGWDMLYPVLLDMEEIIPGCGLRGFYQLGGWGDKPERIKSLETLDSFHPTTC